jgi:ADP-ribose pyrophosphatase YjhB (NUDIX family)
LKVCPLCANELLSADVGGKVRLACVNIVCEFVHWDNPKPVTATLIPRDGGLVLVKRAVEPFVGWWCLPGGFIEPTEHPADSAIREVKEETGLDVELHRLLDACSPGRGINVIILFYLAKPCQNGLFLPGDDASDVGVFAKDQLPENICFELHRRMIRQYFDDENVLFDAQMGLKIRL